MKEGRLPFLVNGSINVRDGTIHFTFIIFKKAHQAHFAHQPSDIGFVVTLFNSKKEKEALFLLSDDLIVDGYASFGDSLEENTHL